MYLIPNVPFTQMSKVCKKYYDMQNEETVLKMNAARID